MKLWIDAVRPAPYGYNMRRIIKKNGWKEV